MAYLYRSQSLCLRILACDGKEVYLYLDDTQDYERNPLAHFCHRYKGASYLFVLQKSILFSDDIRSLLCLDSYRHFYG